MYIIFSFNNNILLEKKRRKIKKIMDQLPSELIQRIFLYIDQPLDLFRMSWVCRRWRSIIMHDEYFLNQWFFQATEVSQKISRIAFFIYINDRKIKSIVHQ